MKKARRMLVLLLAVACLAAVLAGNALADTVYVTHWGTATKNNPYVSNDVGKARLLAIGYDTNGYSVISGWEKQIISTTYTIIGMGTPSKKYASYGEYVYCTYTCVYKNALGVSTSTSNGSLGVSALV
ncbi:MAG: hypothetical protein LBQ91_03310 [Oscillospiraceae bacterium]|jgi:hypothetical protein|nr:hypothetical protein [Oscillospiraceae bacterium]